MMKDIINNFGIWLHRESNWSPYNPDEDIVPVCLLLLCFLLIAVCICVMIYTGIYTLINRKTSIYKQLWGTLIDKKYIGEQQHSGKGTAIMPNTSGGIGVGIVSTRSTSPEQFLLFVQSDIIYKIPVDMQSYYDCTLDSKVNFTVRIGGLDKSILKIYLNDRTN